MPQSYHKIWIHLIWGTKERFPVLTSDLLPQVLQHIRARAEQEGYLLDAINGTADHIHCLIEIGLTHNVSTIANLLKGESSHWINAGKLTGSHFAWQEGYGAFSVSASQLDKVRDYIKNQKEHHRQKTYREELDEFLKAYDIGEQRP
ncbi:IS200/IS605 family transposase [candidate division TA06 bacterium]|uniref:IS200/IS605 family transposase n=1 Tax=candidate division TA06 bacterium TaxID=2250710 RepID=A0A933MIM4_UNCT6|nr:IS200/IS605 family transposase [candidate division TA06 bacterium]